MLKVWDWKNKMKNVEYKIKSLPGKCVQVPEETAVKAQEFLDFVLEVRQPASLVSRVMDFTYIVRTSIGDNAYLMIKLKDSGEAKDAEKLALQDKLYLDTCLFIHGYNESSNSKDMPDFLNPIRDALKEVCEI
jgi:hypothetical protein